jgi:hypothetical protein
MDEIQINDDVFLGFLPSYTAVAYIFVICNGCTGIFVLIYTILGNPQVSLTLNLYKLHFLDFLHKKTVHCSFFSLQSRPKCNGYIILSVYQFDLGEWDSYIVPNV